eukprot:TRINITY_DN8002_c0_g1_i1.p1 TRINITY_DN8002_c0_g1~~TRINITY_DN8002_c0_g1_i1.p1  ORF type:complete len:342 (+),score=63.24 TRINITY_DN8002_c0_g1_i1:45-1070(+)
MGDTDALIKEAEALKETIRANLKGSADTTLAQFANDVPALQNASLKIRRTLKGHLSKIYAMQWSGDQPTLASASQDGRLIVWNAVTCLKMHAIALPSNWVMCCGYSPSGDFVASGGLDNICSVWNLKNTTNNSKPLRELSSHTGFLSGCRFIDNNRVITSSGDHTCILWDLETNTNVTTFRSHDADVMNLSISPDTSTFVSGGVDKTAITWDINSGKRIFQYEVSNSDVNAVSFFPGGNAIATGSEDGIARLFDIRARNLLNTYALNNNAPPITSLAFSSSGRYLFSSYAADPDCLVWDTLKAERKGQVQGHQKRITSVGVSGDGAALCTASWDTFMKIWT